MSTPTIDQTYARMLVDPRVELRDHRDNTRAPNSSTLGSGAHPLIVVHVHTTTKRHRAGGWLGPTRITVENFAIANLGSGVFDSVGTTRAEVFELAAALLTRRNRTHVFDTLDRWSYSTAGYTVTAET